MKKRFVTVIVIAIVLLATPFTVLAQSYSFSLDQENIIVFLNTDSSISLDYTFVFSNDSGAHEIDFVDVGMPNSSFDIQDVSAEVNGTPVGVSVKEYQGQGSGFAVVLGIASIPPGQTGTVHVVVERIRSVLNRDARDAKYASFQFTPTWFDSELVHGSTDLTVAFHLPPGIPADEGRFHLPGNNWRGVKEPVINLDEDGRIIYTWHDDQASGSTSYVFGASFPLNYVPTYATQIAQPPVSPQAKSRGLAGYLLGGFVVLVIIGAVIFLKRSERRDNRLGYLPPQIAIEGYGIRRGLTAVEAAIVLEQPLEKILTMILFGVVKKGLAKITRRDPLQLDIAADLPKDLYAYEESFLDAFHIEDARNREEKLQQMFIDLIKAVSEKMRGFSQDETQLYYRGIVQRAWEQVQGAGTPEVKNREFDRSLDWLMLNHRFTENVQELFKDPGMRTPQWWESYDLDFTLPTPRVRYEERSSRSDSKTDRERPVARPPAEPLSTTGQAAPEPRGLLGADYAAAIVNSVQDFSSRVIHDVDQFTERVHEVTQLRPAYTSPSDLVDDIFKPRSRTSEEDFDAPERSGGSSASADGFWSLFSGSGESSSPGSSSHYGSSSSSSSSSSSRHSSCACACAGCACACAGGGR